MCSGSEAGSYSRLIDSCITQLKAQGPSRTCNESKDERKEEVDQRGVVGRQEDPPRSVRCSHLKREPAGYEPFELDGRSLPTRSPPRPEEPCPPFRTIPLPSERNVKRFRGGLVFKAHRPFVSLNSRLEINKEEEKNYPPEAFAAPT